MSGDVLSEYVDVRRLRATKDMSFFQQGCYCPVPEVRCISPATFLRKSPLTPLFQRGGYPLAGRSSRHRLSCGEDFFSSSPNFHLVESSIVSYAPLFSIGRCRINRSAPVTHQDQGIGRFLKKRISSRPWQNFLAPENCRYHAVSKVNRITDPVAHPFGVQPQCGSRRGRTI
jgi:hypothetical protein